jgi:glutamate-1-semialdehyde aminotransferase
LSKAPSQWCQAAPKFIERGHGPNVFDADGHSYVDLSAALGPVILGYGIQDINDAVVDRLCDGAGFLLPHRLEVEVAERLVEIIPGAEQVRFVKNGSDATAAAVRLARIYTGREHVIATGYHGQHDWYMASSEYSAGIPIAVKDSISGVPLDDLSKIERVLRLRKSAAVILEAANAYVPTVDHLRSVIDIAHHHGALVIFDEVVTGFRLALGGAQEYFDVQADLACLGKAIANGMPLAAVTGPERIMRDIGFLSYTHAGETLSLAAAKTTIDVLRSEPVVEHLWATGAIMATGIRKAIDDYDLRGWMVLTGLAPRMVLKTRESNVSRPAVKSLLQQELIKQDVLWNGNIVPTYAFSVETAERVIRAFHAAFEVVAKALPDNVEFWLEGEPAQGVPWNR